MPIFTKDIGRTVGCISNKLLHEEEKKKEKKSLEELISVFFRCKLADFSVLAR
jgi:hypothetical protein